MKTRTKVSIAIPFVLFAVMLTANVAAYPSNNAASDTATPIKHVVVIFQENVSTDHYFATYPNAANSPNEPQFTAAPGTPSANDLTGPLLTSNPNELVTGNPSDNPARLDRTQPVTCDNDHDYTAEQAAFNGGLMNMFPEQTSCSDGIVMDYYDGNTVTALWNYAQNFALNDNAFGTTFGPSTPGALNVVSGLGGPADITTTPSVPTSTGTGGTFSVAGATTSGANSAGTLENGQLIGDIDPTYDDCSYSQDGDTSTAAMVSTGSDVPLNIGNLLNTAGVTWGWFQGGFTPTVPYNPTTGAPAQCGSSEAQVGGTIEAAYSPHHEPFEYFASTANPHHLPPSSPSMIGLTDQANHQYDLSSFWIAADSGNLPAVSYLKAPRFQDGHPGNSDPLDEQAWLVNTINTLENLPTWSSTAIIVNWDDSDGWYDSVMPPIVNPSSDPASDVLNGVGVCGAGTSPLGVQDRCGYGPRIPILVISPYAKSNFVDSTLVDQSSIVSFIQYNWHLGSLGSASYTTIAGSLLNMFDFSHQQPAGNKLFLNPSTGEVVQTGYGFGFGSQASAADQGQANTPGTPNLKTTSTCTDVDTNPDVCATQNNFSNGAIAAGNYVWFSAEADITTRETSGTTVFFTGQAVNLQLQGGNGLPLTIPAPNAEVVFSSSATTETTTYTGGKWVTTVPADYTGNVFVGGVAYQVPTGVSLAGAKVDWEGVFSGTTVSFTLNWQWAAAVYSNLGTGLGTGIGSNSATTAFYNGLGITSIDASGGNHAGTPENFVADYLTSATGGHGPFGSSQYTGVYNQPGNAYYQAYLLNE